MLSEAHRERERERERECVLFTECVSRAVQLGARCHVQVDVTWAPVVEHGSRGRPSQHIPLPYCSLCVSWSVLGFTFSVHQVLSVSLGAFSALRFLFTKFSLSQLILKLACEVSRVTWLMLPGKLGCVVSVGFWLLYLVPRFVFGCIVIKITEVFALAM